MNKIKKISSISTIVCLVIAIFLGIFAKDFSISIKPIGKYYIDVLKVLISPVIFVSLSLTIVNRKKGNSSLILKTVCLFIIMFISTFLLTSGIVAIFQPGNGFELVQGDLKATTADTGMQAILKKLLPSDFKTFIYGGNIFFVIVVCIFFSFIVSKTPIKAGYSKVLSFIKKYLFIILEIVILLTPIAILSLVSNTMISYGNSFAQIALKYILFAYGCSILSVALIMILPVWLIAKVNPITYIKKVSKVWLISFSSQSSVATLPYTIKVCNEEFGVDERITDVVVPLGCTIHMCGGAVSFALLGLFVAQMSGTSVTLLMFLIMLSAATAINMAAPGIPGGGKVIGMTYLSILSLPLDPFYGFYVSIYTILDMCYTTLNVTGDVSANILLNCNENKNNK